MDVLDIKNYRDLIVWQKAMDLVEEIYKLTNEFPRDEVFVLVNQIRRAAISIPSNIAEGNSRKTKQDYARFLAIARGSKSEVETQIEICIRLHYLTQEQANSVLALCEEIGKMLNRIIQKLIPNP